MTRSRQKYDITLAFVRLISFIVPLLLHFLKNIKNISCIIKIINIIITIIILYVEINDKFIMDIKQIKASMDKD